MNTQMNNMTDSELDSAILSAFQSGAMPDEARDQMNRTYAALNKIPQLSHSRVKRFGKGAAIFAVAAALTAVTGVAFAASSLLKMEAGDASFFQHDANLPVFASMEKGAKELSADVGATTDFEDMQITLDSISCDRNVANVYLTLHKAGGFDPNKMSIYEGSEENEWARLQSAMPRIEYTVRGEDGALQEGTARQLDAYTESDSIKCMMRITPTKVMPDQAWIELRAFSFEDGKTHDLFDVGLDMTEVATPRELDGQELTFDTQQGEKRIDILRFTSSELATVMVSKTELTTKYEDSGRPISNTSDEAIDPRSLKITDNTGNTLYPVDAGDGAGISDDAIQVTEYANLSPEAESITFTPILTNSEVFENAARSDNGIKQVVDVSQVGAKVATSEIGGYEIASWDVVAHTVSITLKPYGWVVGIPELSPKGTVTMLEEEWTDPETGQSGVGAHSGVVYWKYDYMTGDVMQITSYYAAGEEELKALHEYGYNTSPSGGYVEESSASITLAFA